MATRHDSPQYKVTTSYFNWGDEYIVQSESIVLPQYEGRSAYGGISVGNDTLRSIGSQQIKPSQ